MKIKNNQSGIAHFAMLIILLIVIMLIGFVGWKVWDMSQNKSDNSVSTPTIKDVDNKASSASKATTTTFSGTNGDLTISVEHPSDWEVTSDKKMYDGNEVTPTYNVVSIKSAQGTYLHISDPTGFGGSCDPDNDSYTLAKKIATGTENVFFTEYTTSSAGYPKTHLRIEDVSNSDPKHKNMKEGDTNTNVCENVSGYSSVSAKNGKSSAFVIVNKNVNDTLKANTDYADISKDSDFVAMLGTLKVN